MFSSPLGLFLCIIYLWIEESLNKFVEQNFKALQCAVVSNNYKMRSGDSIRS